MENEEVERRREKKKKKRKSCLVNPLLFRIYQKSSFNRTVCVGSTLNPPLHNPIRRPRLSCANKHGNGSLHIQQRKEAKKKRGTLRPNLFQMAPIDHIIYIGCVRVPKATLLRFTIVGSLTQIPFLLLLLLLSRALISAEPQEDGSLLWKGALLTHRCGVTPTHLLERINLHPPPASPPHMGFLMIFNPQAGNALCTDQRASFPLVRLAPLRSPVNCGPIFGTHYPSAQSAQTRVVSLARDL